MMNRICFIVTMTGLILTLVSCDIRNGRDFSGFEEVMEPGKITSVSGEAEHSLLDIYLPDADSINFDYSAYLQDIRFVKLEKKAGSYIGNIDKIFISGKHIVIVDTRLSQSVLIFDSTGKFMHKIVPGKKGANTSNELKNFLDVAFNEEEQEIIIHDDKKGKLYFYDMEGRLKRTRKEYLAFFNFAHLKGTDNYVYMDLYTQNTHIPALMKSNLYLGRENTRILKIAPEAVQHLKIKDNYHYQYNLSSFNSIDLFYTPVFSDTIYAINGKEPNVYPRFVLHLPGRDIIERVREDSMMNVEQLNMILNSRKYYSFDGKALSNNESIFYFECHKGSNKSYFYSERTHKVIGGNVVTRLTDKDSLRIEFYDYPIATYNNEFVSIIKPAEIAPGFNTLRTEKLSAVLKDYGSSDNPILVFYKLKEF